MINKNSLRIICLLQATEIFIRAIQVARTWTWTFTMPRSMFIDFSFKPLESDEKWWTWKCSWNEEMRNIMFVYWEIIFAFLFLFFVNKTVHCFAPIEFLFVEIFSSRIRIFEPGFEISLPDPLIGSKLWGWVWVYYNGWNMYASEYMAQLNANNLFTTVFNIWLTVLKNSDLAFKKNKSGGNIK